MALSRRESLRRAALLAAGSGLPHATLAANEMTAPWQWPQLPPILAPGYGTDPDLIHPRAPWPLTLSRAQRKLAGTLADILIPAEDDHPAASAVGVVDVLDEWVSAPYPDQQAHRRTILAGFDWLDREAVRRHRSMFLDLGAADQLAIIDQIAFSDTGATSQLSEPVAFFDLLRRLVTGMYYSSPEGVAELGWVGNVPIAGDYPGPSTEAMRHLQQILAELELD